MTTMTTKNRIRNFRPAAGFIVENENESENDKSIVSSTARVISTVYRCGSTDVLGREEEKEEENISRSLSSSSSSSSSYED